MVEQEPELALRFAGRNTNESEYPLRHSSLSGLGITVAATKKGTRKPQQDRRPLPVVNGRIEPRTAPRHRWTQAVPERLRTKPAGPGSRDSAAACHPSAPSIPLNSRKALSPERHFLLFRLFLKWQRKIIKNTRTIIVYELPLTIEQNLAFLTAPPSR